ncbi:TPA: M56 family metallopeptidase [Clostridioides difficile]
MKYTFEKFKLNEKILKSLKSLGYNIPSRVQREVIPKLLKGKNLVVRSKTGSGKTASFAIPLCENINVKKKIELRGSDELISPAGMGLFKSYIFLPDYPYSKDELTWILKHELMHFKNKDILIKFLVLSVKIMYWFNPLVYIMSNKVNLDCELCCDESVLTDCSLNDKKEYALALIKSIKLSNNYNSGILTTEFNKTSLEKRLDSIVKKKGKSGILVLLILFTLFSVTYFNFESISFDNPNFLRNMGILEKSGANLREEYDYNMKIVYPN